MFHHYLLDVVYIGLVIMQLLSVVMVCLAAFISSLNAGARLLLTCCFDLQLIIHLCIIKVIT